MTLLDPTSGAGYPFGTKLPSTDVNTVWNQQPNAADFVGGGSYSLAASLTCTVASTKTFKIDGAGVAWFKPAALELGDNGLQVTFPTGVLVTDVGTWAHSAGHTISAGTWSFGASSTVDLIGAVTMASTTTLVTNSSTSWTINNGPAFAGGFVVSGPSGVTSPMTLSGAGQFIKRYSKPTDANHTYDVATYDIIDLSASTGGRTQSLNNTGAAAGSTIRFMGAPASQQDIVVTTLGTLGFKSTGAGLYQWADLVFDGSQWRLSAWLTNP